MKDLVGKRVVVIGGGSGMGLATAREAASLRASVAHRRHLAAAAGLADRYCGY